eukprot:514096-Rhodomonas_salina.1
MSDPPALTNQTGFQPEVTASSRQSERAEQMMHGLHCHLASNSTLKTPWKLSTQTGVASARPQPPDLNFRHPATDSHRLRPGT